MHADTQILTHTRVDTGFGGGEPKIGGGAPEIGGQAQEIGGGAPKVDEGAQVEIMVVGVMPKFE